MHKNEIYFPSYVWKNKLNYQYSDELTSSILEDYNKVKKHKCKFNLEKTTCYMRDLDDNDLNKFSRMDLIEKIISSISKEFEKYLKYNNINSKFHFTEYGTVYMKLVWRRTFTITTQILVVHII